MDCHRSLSSVAALEAYVVFKIFAYDLENLKIFFREFLLVIALRLFLRLCHPLYLLFKLAYGHVILDYFVTEMLLKNLVVHSEQDLCVAYAEKTYLQVVLDLCRKLASCRL